MVLDKCHGRIFFCSAYDINFGMYLIFVIYYGKVKMANLSYYYFWSTTPPQYPKFFSIHKTSRLKGKAGHTSSTVQSELLLGMEYTTYMIIPCTQSPLNVSVGILKLVFLFEPMNA